VLPVRRFVFISLCLVVFSAVGITPPDSSEFTGRRNCEHLCDNVVGLINPKTNFNENYVLDKTLYRLRLDTLTQIKFWRNIMKLNEDSAILNFANSRRVLQTISLKEWNEKNDSLKKWYRDSIRFVNCLDTTHRILLTVGKKFFYDFEKTSVNIEKGIHCFVENQVDPWFAQAILLIESPNKLQKSNAGAYGPFQLMKDVARLYGLKVNKTEDERADFEKSAFAASSLIKNICIPKAYKILDSLGIRNFSETELWFKLLVMHVYHAGAYNVQSALFTFRPSEGNMDLIFNLWKAQTSRFKSASQNYSQLVLAAMFEMNDKLAFFNENFFALKQQMN
jgi:hypothetical protein